LHLARTRLATDTGDRGLQQFTHFDTHRITLARRTDNPRPAHATLWKTSPDLSLGAGKGVRRLRRGLVRRLGRVV
jgi:hypothetical protein